MRLKRIGKIGIEEVISKIVVRGKSRTKVLLCGQLVNIDSFRLNAFKKSIRCVSCGIEGSFFAVEKDRGATIYHVNLYAQNGEEEILMTHDHIIPRCKGGSNALSNIQTMCTKCNNLKGAMTMEEFERCRLGIAPKQGAIPKMLKILDDRRVPPDTF